MKKILFICHGNICRSPMGEFILKDLVRKSGREEEFEISSAAVSYEEEGNGIYPPARRVLSAHGIQFSGHTAHRVSAEEAGEADIIIIMDESNRRRLERIIREKDMQKVHMMMEFAGEPGRSVSDPWYTGDFETSYNDILEGCRGLLKEI